MDTGKKQMGSSSSSSSSSSFTSDLFDSKDSSSMNAVFGSIFDSKDAGGKKNDPSSSRTEYQNLDSIFGKQVQQPFNYNSSIYYGGQDNYSDPQSTNTSTSGTTYKKDGEQDDPNAASRGNWWQGSLYY